MRDIKFRAWHDSTKQMICMDKSGTLGLSAGDILNRFDTVMQYTGIKDKNGVEIYDGDILTNHQGDIQVVKYSGCQWITKLIQRKTSWWPAQYLHCEYMGWIIIGNIYESAL